MKGLYHKYIVTKADGSPTDPNADYLVLRLDTDAKARMATWFYAGLIALEDTNNCFAKDLATKLEQYLPADSQKEGGTR